MRKIQLHARCVAAALMLLLSVVEVSAQAKSDELSGKDVAQIRVVNEAYATNWLKNDAEAVLSILTKDAVLIPQGNHSIEGIEAIRKFWWPMDGSRTTIKTFTITTDEVGGSGGVAYVRGTFKFSFTYEERGKTSDLTNAGNYLMILKRQPDGAWLISHRMWGDLRR